MTQALISAVGDICAYRLALRIGGVSCGNFFVRCYLQLILHMSSFYLLYTSSRTLSNTAEAAFVSIALYFWPLSARGASRTRFLLALAAAYVAVLFRPTSLLLWVFLGVHHLSNMRKLGAAHVVRAIVDAAVVGYAAADRTLVLGLGTLADSLYYGRVVFTPATFFVENVVNSVSVFYGTHPWHWYLTQGLPFMLTVALPWVFIGWYRVLTNRIQARDRDATRCIALAAVWMVATYSLLSHKEFRFIQSVLPMLHICGALFLASEAPNSTNISDTIRSLPRYLRLLMLIQVPVAVYALAFHARGQVAIMGVLHNLAQSTSVHSIGFLMPCHSTPWQSHLHTQHLGADSGNKVWFIECPPPGPRDGPMYWDQSDFFYYDPVTYILDRFPTHVDPEFPPDRDAVTKQSGVPAARASYDLGWQHSWPSHLVMFGALLNTQGRNGLSVKEVLSEKGYTELCRIWNTLFHPDRRRQGDIVVMKHNAA